MSHWVTEASSESVKRTTSHDLSGDWCTVTKMIVRMRFRWQIFSILNAKEWWKPQQISSDGTFVMFDVWSIMFGTISFSWCLNLSLVAGSQEVLMTLHMPPLFLYVKGRGWCHLPNFLVEILNWHWAQTSRNISKHNQDGMKVTNTHDR